MDSWNCEADEISPKLVPGHKWPEVIMSDDYYKHLDNYPLASNHLLDTE